MSSDPYDIDEERAMRHELGNMVASFQSAVYTASEKNRYDGIEDDCADFVEQYHELMDAVREGEDIAEDLELFYGAAEEMGEGFETYARCLARTADGVIAYSEDDMDGSISIEELLEPVAYQGGGTDIRSEPDARVAGGEALMVVTSTLVKNWKNHGQPEEGEPRLHARADSDGGEYVIDIWDNGPGMDPATAEREMEQKGETDGLGLVLAANVMDRAGGDIRYLEPEEADERIEAEIGDIGAGFRMRYRPV